MRTPIESPLMPIQYQEISKGFESLSPAEVRQLIDCYVLVVIFKSDGDANASVIITVNSSPDTE